MMEKDVLHYDVVVVGAGPAGLAAACKLKQLAQENALECSVCVVEKAAAIGGHLLSGALLQPTALNELFPNWKEMGAPLNVPVKKDEVSYLVSGQSALNFPHFAAKRMINNEGNYVVSIGQVCGWLSEQAEQLGVEIYTGFSAEKLLLENDVVVGIETGAMGLDQNSNPKPNYQPGIELRAKYTLFAEGCRGHLGKQLIAHYRLDENTGTQHYGLGIKEVWQIPPDQHRLGHVFHGFGWPLSRSGTGGGGFLYHFENNTVSLGLITDLNYSNPHLSPFDELQLWKTHPKVAAVLKGGKRIAYGARAINKGGLQAIPKLSFPGGMLLGCDAGFMNYPKIKGNHTAMKSGMITAEVVFNAIKDNREQQDLDEIESAIKQSWLYDELNQARNVAPAMHKWGMMLGSIFSFIDYGIFRGKLPYTLKDDQPDHQCLMPADKSAPLSYPKPDGVITFDKLSSVYLSNTHHGENQPCHLKLHDPELPLGFHWSQFREPAQRYCPAGVYEITEEEGGRKFVINSQNCLHCKTCDIKDPSANITWVPPEAGGGPNYGAM